MSESESLETFLESIARATWDVFRKDALLFVLAGVVFVLVAGISFGLCLPPLLVGFSELVRRRNQGQAASVGDLFSGFSKFGSSFFAMILIGIGWIVGTCLLVLPGVLFMVFATFTVQAIAYESSSAIDSIKRSFNIVKDSFAKVLVLLLCLSVVQMVGGSIVVGTLLTLPLSMIALCVAFERLSASAPATQTLGPSAAQVI